MSKKHKKEQNKKLTKKQAKKSHGGRAVNAEVVYAVDGEDSELVNDGKIADVEIGGGSRRDERQWQRDSNRE